MGRGGSRARLRARPWQTLSMRRCPAACLVAWASLAWIGCGDEADPARIDVIVSDVEPGLGAEIDRVEISMSLVPDGEADPTIVAKAVVARGGRIEPLSASFEPLAASHVGRRLYRFRVVGFRGAEPRVRAQHRVSFVARTRLTLPIRLSPACVGVSCGDDETCNPMGVCVDSFLASCALIEGAPPDACPEPPSIDGSIDAPADTGAPDAEPPSDAGGDGGDTGDAGDGGPPVDAGPPTGCGPAGEVCDDGVACTIDGCLDGACTTFLDDVLCDDGVDCTLDVCEPSGCRHEVRDTRCDDGNPCTEDRCRESGCVAEPNAAACDDGFFCSGADTCAGGGCAIHAGDPCPGSSACVEAGATCEGCVTDADCPAPEASPWSACSGFVDACDGDGVSMRTTATFRCGDGGVCTRVESAETMPCTRPTDGIACVDDANACTDDVCVAGACAHRPRAGATCPSGYCDATARCVRCLDDSHCADGDRCTADVCDGAGECTRSSSRMEVSLRTSFGLEGFCTDDGGGGYQRVEAGCFFTETTAMSLHRGYLTFDTRSAPAGAVVTRATIRLCATGGPGASLAELYPVVDVPVPLDCAGIFAIGPAGPRAAVIPDVLGPIALPLPVDTVRPGAYTQLGLHYPETSCDEGTWVAKRYAVSNGLAATPECPADSPSWLDVSYCTAPY